MKSIFAPFVSFIVLAILWGVALFTLPADAYQGEVYKILYLHVPAAFGAFFCGFTLFLASLASLRKRSFGFYIAQSSAEIGLILTVLTLATGSIWGRPTWGTWWTWDARLTTTLILAMLYGAYLLVGLSVDDRSLRQKVCGILGVLIFCDLPVIYKSVTWWRTLHQPPSILRDGGSTMSSSVLIHLLLCILFFGITVLGLVYERAKQLRLGVSLENIHKSGR